MFREQIFDTFVENIYSSKYLWENFLQILIEYNIYFRYAMWASPNSFFVTDGVTKEQGWALTS